MLDIIDRLKAQLPAKWDQLKWFESERVIADAIAEIERLRAAQVGVNVGVSGSGETQSAETSSA